MASDLPVVRGAYLIVLQRVLRELGVPVNGSLEKYGLPPIDELRPDDYISLVAGLEWLRHCRREIELSDLGFMAAERSSLATFSPRLQAAILNAPSGLTRLDAFLELAPIEQSEVTVRLDREAAGLRVICDLEAFRRHPALGASEWIQVHAIVSIVRSVAGRSWAPAEITFMSRDRLPYAALDAYGNTRILCGQAHTSVLVPEHLLATPCSLPAVDRGVETAEPAAWDFLHALRQVIRPYLRAGCCPGLEDAAALAGLSPRTLQRKLAEHGHTYSRLVQEVRYEVACDLLADPTMKIIDVAFAAGYEHPQHFARAFRQLAGVSPRDFRRQVLAYA